MDLRVVTYRLAAEDRLLIGRDEGERVKGLVCAELKRLPRMTVLCLDFSDIKFVDGSGVDEVVVLVQGRIAAGEFPDRFLTIRSINSQKRENLELALGVAGKAVIVDLGPGEWTLLGHVNTALVQALTYIAERGGATARDLVDGLDIDPVNTASTRLVQLYEAGLVAREPWRQPVRGGGRQFRYMPLVRGKYVAEVAWESSIAALR